MARWSLRSKLVTLVALALLPVLGLAAWQAEREEAAGIARRGVALSSVADLAVARYSGLFDASTRLLAAACADEAVEASAAADAAPTVIGRCESYLSRLLAAYPDQYSTALVTDEQGVARCATAPNAIGMSFADRDVFQKVRSSKEMVVGDTIVSRIAPKPIVPIAIPITRDGTFRGMCTVGITLKALARSAADVEGSSGVAVAVVDRSGAAIGGDAQALR